MNDEVKEGDNADVLIALDSTAIKFVMWKTENIS